jgi:hypothetical protein
MVIIRRALKFVLLGKNRDLNWIEVFHLAQNLTNSSSSKHKIYVIE